MISTILGYSPNVKKPNTDHCFNISDENLFKHMIREMISFKIKPLSNSIQNDVDMCAAIVCGKSFLHKQVYRIHGFLWLK